MRTTEPIWADALPAPLPRFPGGIVRADVAVVGGGLTGLSAALRILRARPGARVVVLEAGRIGAGASGRTTGMLGPGVGQSLPALVRRLGDGRATALYRASLHAVADLAALVAAEGIDCELQLGGQLVVARAPGDRARLATLAALLERLGLPGEALDDSALAARLRLGATARGDGPAAVLLPVAGTLHPGRLLAGLVDRVVAAGGVVLEGARVLAIGRGKPVRLELEGGEVVAPDVVVATAGYTADLGMLRGRILPVHLQALVTEPLDAAARAAIGWEGGEGVLDARRVFSYFRTTSDGRIVFGGGAPRYRWGGSTDDGDAARPLERLAREMAATFPAEARLRVAGGWTGVIGYVLDGLPAIQRWRDNPAVVHAVGWCGHGVALSVASGAWIVDLLEHAADGAAPPLPWFRDDPPLVPLEPVRWLAFRTAVQVMAWKDGAS